MSLMLLHKSLIFFVLLLVSSSPVLAFRYSLCLFLTSLLDVRPGRDADPSPPSSAEVKNRVELYLYSPEGSSWPMEG